MYTFNENSWHAKLYKKIWKEDPSEFSNLCGYFWTSILGVIICPIILLRRWYLGFKSSRNVSSLKEDSPIVYETKKKLRQFQFFMVYGKGSRFTYWLSRIAKWAFISFLVLWIMFMCLAIIYTIYVNPYSIKSMIIPLTLGFCLFTDKGQKIIGRFFRLAFDIIKSTYKNYCPILKWKKDE